MHAVRKEQSTTTKIRAVFDASAKSSTGISLNDTLLVGPTVHSSLLDVLLKFRIHCVALTTDVSKMYQAVNLAMSDRDLHRFLWRKSVTDTLVDYRMTHVTFGVSASSFAANMAVQQNALDLAIEYPRAAKIVADMWMMVLLELTRSKKLLSCKSNCSHCFCEEVSFCANGIQVNPMF